jgi:hypothetical protein
MRTMSPASISYRSVQYKMDFMLLLLLVVTVVARSYVVDASVVDLQDCGNGTCPTPAINTKPVCGLWLGPSPIKEAEDHGFGLGMFTGRYIPKGSVVESMYSQRGEVLIPLFASKVQENHPPLREYVWEEGNLPEIGTENLHGTTFYFIPGLAAIAPCTSQNFNLLFSSTSGASDGGGVHRARNPAAGSFSYRHNVTYTAVRDIVPGEELTVSCSDDDFDGGAYYLSSYQSSEDAVVCLDDKLRIGTSTIPGIGQGLFAKGKLAKGSLIISTPLVPIHRRELDIVIKGSNDPPDISAKQLLLNYCFGHPNSDLLLLPYGPMVGHLNHGPQPNAVIRWHELPADKTGAPRRQQFHHAELRDWSAEKVADAHGMGLMVDIVALREIHPNEEIRLDYGQEWAEAWEVHMSSWSERDGMYTSASDYTLTVGDILRTQLEQKENPYPDSLRVMCFYDEHLRKNKAREGLNEVWDDDSANTCIRPCIILERHYKTTDSALYTVKLSPTDNNDVYEHCELNTEIIVSDVPRHAIRILDRPYTADMFLPKAFRHEIGVPDGFYPETWMKKKLRRQPNTADGDGGARFKRKKAIKKG